MKPFHSGKIFGLIDCNNFYVSCERLFRPDLHDRPVVVLSNNDGCIIARSNEVKRLGIPMGAPYFKQKPLIRQHDIAVFSSNYSLYGDISQRVMDTLMQLEPDVEIYSIDEAFIEFPAGRHIQLDRYAAFLRSIVRQHTGIPVSIGFGPTKTLAKIAGSIAKKHSGCFVMDTQHCLQDILARVDVADIWGIGRRYGKRLKNRGIQTALELTECDDEWIRKQLTVTGLRTVMELRGVSCISLEKAASARKSIVTSRSFGQPVRTLSHLQEAVASYATQAAAKLRWGSQRATVVQVFIRTNSFRRNQPQYRNSRTVTLPAPSSDTAALIKTSLASLKSIYRSGYLYQKAGVMLSGLVADKQEQMRIFAAPGTDNSSLIKAVDRINQRWGNSTIHPATAGLSREWHYRQMKKSPAYTTCWSELPVAKASSPEIVSMA